MNVYEICIFNEVHHSSVIIAASHVSDFAAIRSARKLAGNRSVEVWRDSDCIYQVPDHAALDCTIAAA